MRPVAVVGPSGAGKGMLMTLACAADPRLRAVRRVITRPAGAGEDFESVNEAEFARRLAAGEFVLHWRAHGLCYGIPAAALAGEGIAMQQAEPPPSGTSARKSPRFASRRPGSSTGASRAVSAAPSVTRL